jgi:hypothetical protein
MREAKDARLKAPAQHLNIYASMGCWLFGVLFSCQRAIKPSPGGPKTKFRDPIHRRLENSVASDEWLGQTIRPAAFRVRNSPLVLLSVFRKFASAQQIGAGNKINLP